MRIKNRRGGIGAGGKEGRNGLGFLFPGCGYECGELREDQRKEEEIALADEEKRQRNSRGNKGWHTICPIFF